MLPMRWMLRFVVVLVFLIVFLQISKTSFTPHLKVVLWTVAVNIVISAQWQQHSNITHISLSQSWVAVTNFCNTVQHRENIFPWERSAAVSQLMVSWLGRRSALSICLPVRHYASIFLFPTVFLQFQTTIVGNIWRPRRWSFFIILYNQYWRDFTQVCWIMMLKVHFNGCMDHYILGQLYQQSKFPTLKTFFL